MGKSKEVAQAPEQAAPVEKTEEQQKPAKKKLGRVQLARFQSAAMPPPDGSPSLARAGAMVGTQSSGIGTSNRAGMANTLQRQAGNARLGRMAGTVQRKIAGAGSQSHPTIQFQLLVNQPGDAAEQEADNVAAHVTGKQASPTLQRQAASAATPEVTPEIENQINTSRGNGQKLTDSVRAPMENSMGADLSGVKVHTDSTADHLSSSLNARAFTTGKDVFFKQGEFNPGTSSGGELLAHELTHVVQQSQDNEHPVQRDDAATQSEDRQPFVGEKANIPAEVKAPLGIILHTTPSPNDADYQRKRDAANKNDFIYPKGSIVTVIAFGNAQHAGWVMIKTEKGESGWIERRFLSPMSQQEEIEQTRRKSGGFMIKSTAGSTVPIGSEITYSVVRTDVASPAGQNSYHYSWSVENDPSTHAKAVENRWWLPPPLTIQGPKDKESWTLRAGFPGTHLIKVKISRGDTNVATLVYTQRVSSAKEESKQELFLLKFFGGDEFLLSLTATKGFGEANPKGKAELSSRSSGARQWQKVYWDVRGREVEDKMNAITWGGRYIEAKPFSREIQIPDWSWFSPKLLEHTLSQLIKVGSTGYPEGTYKVYEGEGFSFDFDNDLKPDFSIRVDHREDPIDREYSIMTSDNKKIELYNVSFFQPDAWKYYRGPYTPRKEKESFLEALTSVFDVAIGLIPVIGDLVDLAEAITGYTKWGEKMSTSARVVTALSVVIPFVGGSILRKVGGEAAQELAKLAAKLGKSGDDVLAIVKAVEKSGSPHADEIARMRKVLEAGAKLGKEELERLAGILREIDIEAKVAKATPVGAAEKELERETAESLVQNVEKRGIAKDLSRRVLWVIQDFIKSVKEWAQSVFQKFGFRRYVVEVEGDWLALYGIRSKVLLARFRRDSLEEWIVNDTKKLEELRHSRASQLGAAGAAKSSGNDALANALRQNAIEISEELGEEAANAVIKSRFASAKLYYKGRGSGKVDLVYRLSSGEFLVVEAKGGAGRLITREVAPGVRAEQGTVAYLRSILQNMGDEGAEVLDALNRGDVRYFLSETPIPPGTAALEATLREFVVPGSR